MPTAPLKGTALRIAREAVREALQDLDSASAIVGAAIHDPNAVRAGLSLMATARAHVLRVAKVMNPKAQVPEGEVPRGDVVRDLRVLYTMLEENNQREAIQDCLSMLTSKYSTNPETDAPG